MNRIVSCKSQKESDGARKNLSGKYRDTLLGTHHLGNILILAVFVLLFGCCVRKRSPKFVDPFNVCSVLSHFSCRIRDQVKASQFVALEIKRK